MTPEFALIGILWAWVVGRMATLGPRLDSLHWMPPITASHWYRINEIKFLIPHTVLAWGIVLHCISCFVMIAHTSRVTYTIACLHAVLCVAWVPLFFERVFTFKRLATMLGCAEVAALLTGPVGLPAFVVVLWPTIMTVHLAKTNPTIIDEVPYIPRVPRVQEV
tara:strand:+ start:263 stop:754 length:492 start_codon:yes stop_codon:yes gene_type:complete